jgi:ubiquinone/menaquinone biosynthesis C-methylase UbiE
MNNHQGYVNKDYLENASLVFKEIKHSSYEKMSISLGDRVLDVGCGPGIDVVGLAKLVSQNGLAVGIDYDSEMIAEATTLSGSQGVSDNVEFHVHDVAALPFENNYFDSCRSERVFMHLTDPLTTLKEMHRVTKPNGHIVVTDSDWSSLSIDCQLSDIEMKLFQFHRTKVMASGYTGRSLFRFFREVGISDIQIDIFPLFTTNLGAFSNLVRLQIIEERALAANAISQDELGRWREQLQKAADDSCFFCSMNIISVSGIKPG